jgi:hypothetical protein
MTTLCATPIPDDLADLIDWPTVEAALIQAWQHGIAPPAADDIWTWLQQTTVLPTGRPWDQRRARLMRRWYRGIDARLRRRPVPGLPGAHQVEEIWLSLGAQLYKSTWLLHAILAMIHHYPRKAAIYMPRLRDLKAVQRGKLRPMIEKAPDIDALLPQSLLAREAALAADLWQIAGSQLYWQQGGVADDYRREDYELILADEYDKFPADVEGEGDPLDLLRARGRTYPHSFLLAGVSSPTKINAHAWRSICSGTHERPLVVLPCCGYANALDPEQVELPEGHTWEDTTPSRVVTERLGRYRCPGCGHLHTDRTLRPAIDACADADAWCPGEWARNADHPLGLWTPHAPRDKEGRLTGPIPPPEGLVHSGQACSLYSPVVSLSRFAAAKARSERGGRRSLITFRNTECALPIIETTVVADVDAIRAAAIPPETYSAGSLPFAIDWLLLHFDQQGNTRDRYWYPWVLRAIRQPRTPGGKPASYLVASGTARDAAELAKLCEQSWPINGTPMLPDLTTMDSANGNAKADIYLWAADDPRRRLLIYGDSRLPPGILWEEIIDTGSKRRRTQKPANVLEYRIHPHRWRDELWESIQAKPQSRLDWYLPNDPDPQYLRSLTSEEQATELRKTRNGIAEEVVWRPRKTQESDDKVTYRTDNHWWDAEASLIALCDILGLMQSPEIDEPTPAEDPSDRQGDWVGDYAGDRW